MKKLTDFFNADRDDVIEDPVEPNEYHFQIDTLTSNSVWGWVKRVGDDEAVCCNVYLDNTLIESDLVCEIWREDLQAAGYAHGGYGFHISFPKIADNIDGVQMRFVDQARGQEIKTLDVPVTRVLAQIERVSPTWVIGWCSRLNDVRPVYVDIWAGGKPVVRDVLTNIARPDVEAVYSGALDCGFAAQLPSGLDLLGSRVSVTRAGNTTPIVSLDVTDLHPDPSDTGSLEGLDKEDLSEVPDLDDLLMSDDLETNERKETSFKLNALAFFEYLHAHDKLSDGAFLLESPAQDVVLLAMEAERRMTVYCRRPADASAPEGRILRSDGEAHDLIFELLRDDLPMSQDGAGQVLYRANCACLIGKGEIRIETWIDGELLTTSTQTLGSRYRGNLERASENRISGWAVDFATLGGATMVDVLVNGILLEQRRTGEPRDDVASQLPSYKFSGFRSTFECGRLGEATLAFDVRFSGTEVRAASRVDKVLTLPKHPLPAVPAQRAVSLAPVTVIVPVYNAVEDVAECIASLLEYTRFGADGHRLILANDASPDPAVRPLLDRYADHDGIDVFHQPENRGYTGNINDAIKRAGGGDVCLLNSDTRVTPQWLQLLRRAAHQDLSIGTVTAVSDNAGAFSVPLRNHANSVPPWMSEAEYGRLITHSARYDHARVPTGSGFCMYIRAELLDDIGLFDEENYPRGYGEENDFCMRALHAGWENIIAENVMVYHERSKSFLGAKESLMDRAGVAIPEAYPEYPVAVARSFALSPEATTMRYRVGREALRAPKLARPRIAYVIGVDSGGTPQTNMDLMSNVQDVYEPYLLLCSTGRLRIFRIEGAQRVEVEAIDFRHPVEAISHDSPDYRRAIADVLQRYAFELIHVRHIGRHGLSLISTARALEIPVLFSLHDFYMICPNVKLLDPEGRFCGGRCTEGEGDCNIELWQSKPQPRLRGAWVKSWQKVMAEVLADCDGLITTSPYARDLVRSTYGRLDGVPFDVIPHARDFADFSVNSRILRGDEALRVFVPGHLVPAKGLHLIRKIKDLDTENLIEFHFAGISSEDISGLGIQHGRYKRENLPNIVAKIRPHIGAVMAVWPETYSHTLTEMWSCGLPVLSTSMGATGERIADHGGGWALDDMSPEAVYEKLLALRAEPTDMIARRHEVEQWQLGYGDDYSIPVMANRYKRVYARTLAQARGRVVPADVAVVSLGRGGDLPPTANAHLTPWLTETLGAHDIHHWPRSLLSLTDRIEAPDVLVVRYHGAGRHGPSLEAALKAWPDVRVVLDLPVDFCATHDPDTPQDPDLAFLLERAEAVMAPGAMVGTRAESQNLTEMFVDAEIGAEYFAKRQFIDGAPQAALPGATAAKVVGVSDGMAARLDAEVMPGTSGWVHRHNQDLVDANFSLIDWQRELTRHRVPGRVSIVVPSFKKVGMTQNMVRTVLEKTDYDDFEIIVVDNGSPDDVWAALQGVRRMGAKVRLLRAPMPLMFAVGSNWGAAAATGEFIVFMNNDMEVEAPDWLSTLIEPLSSRPDVGITGARLLYEDRTVQHGGIVYGSNSLFPYHLHEGASEADADTQKTRSMQAVTGACLAIRASDWAKLRGFNPLFVNGSEDLDLCLRMIHLLRRKVLYVGGATVMHHEGRTPGRGRATLHNRMIFVDLWKDRIVADDFRFLKPVPQMQTTDTELREDFRSYRASTSAT